MLLEILRLALQALRRNVLLEFTAPTRSRTSMGLAHC